MLPTRRRVLACTGRWSGGKVRSIGDFAALSELQSEKAHAYLDGLRRLVGEPPAASTPRNDRVYRRNRAILGPMHAFAYSFLEDHPAGR